MTIEWSYTFLGPTVSGWLSLRYHACVENNSNHFTLD